MNAMEELISLNLPITKLRGMRGYFAERLKKLGVISVRDLLFYFPYRYEDFSRVVPISALEVGKVCTVRGKVERISARNIWRRRMTIVEARIKDKSGTLPITWFNQAYVAKSIPVGAEANFAGKVIERKGILSLVNPLYEVVRGGDTRHTARVVPVYSETKGLTSKGIRFILQPVLEHVRIPETLPREIVDAEKFPSADAAIRAIHFPENMKDAEAARTRFAFEEIFLVSLHMGQERLRTEKKKAYAIPADTKAAKELIKELPFIPTDSQKKALWEVMKDMERPFPMHRLLQGDVGSGKTIVAALSAVMLAEKGFQSAFMAPTEILARQHYEGFLKFFGGKGIGIALLTAHEARISYGAGLEAKTTKAALEREIKSGAAKIVVGTHALLGKRTAFKNLAFVAIDEQHRFGVSQRASLVSSARENVPHFLSMSATPIPRTMSLIMFADLDISLISELPKDRLPIRTKVISTSGRENAYRAIREEIHTGRQAFVVCPRIEPQDIEEPLGFEERMKLEVKSVKEEYKKLSENVFPDLTVAMLHGKMTPAEKERTMRSFAEGDTDILVSTSVIEVGIDVPNATVMMVEGAERFGLAQLYQFRGRVGRGVHQSHCFLFTDREEEETLRRLSYLEKAKNGFELAEYDLKERGPGQFFGTVQSGFPDLAMQALRNPRLLTSAKGYAEGILKEDSGLSRYPGIRERLGQFTKELHRE